MNSNYKHVDEYIASFPPDIQVFLRSIRAIVLKQAPNAVEGISYGMPAYKLHNKPLVYFAAFKHHIGLYATPTGHAPFAAALSAYKQGKGSVQFPFHDVPYDLIERIVQFRVNELDGKA